MNPTGLVAEDDAAVCDGRGAPDRSARLEPPNQFTFVGAQAMHVTITGADVYFSVQIDWAGPDADAFTAASVVTALSGVLPGEFSIFLIVSSHHTVFSSGVNQSVSHRRC